MSPGLHEKQVTDVHVSLELYVFCIFYITCSYKHVSDIHALTNQCCFRCISRSPSSQQFVLIVDGFSLAFALGEHTEMFRNLCQMCEAIGVSFNLMFFFVIDK